MIYSHLKPGGTSFSHALINKLSVTGTFKLIPSTFALIAVHRQTAASKSAKPVRTAQHSLEAGVPTTMPTNPPSRFTHVPSFNVSLGHVGPVEGVGGDFGLGAGGGDFGVEVGGGDFDLWGGGGHGTDFGLGGGGHGTDFGLGGGGDLLHVLHALENVEKKRREKKKMVAKEVKAARAMVVE